MRLIPTAAIAATLHVSALVACAPAPTGTGDPPPTIECGAGTEEVDGTCVPTDVNNTSCGAGTVLDGEECVPDDPLACGDGAIEVDGECVPEYDQVLCGEGTILDGEECIPVPVDITRYDVTHLRIGDGGDETVTLHGPVTVSLGLEIEGADRLLNRTVVVAISQGDGAAFCMLGSFMIDQPSDGVEKIYTGEFFVDAQCGKTAAGADLTLPATFNVAILPDPNGDLSLTDAALEAPIDLTAGAADPRAAGCVADAEADTGACEVAVTVQATAGVEFETDRLEVRTPAVVLPAACDPSAAEWASTPEAYRCNGAVTQNLDGVWVYGKPDIMLDLTVLAWGVDHQIAVDDPEDNVAPNLLAEEDLNITYSIKPVSVTDEAAWQPLYLHNEGDPARAEEFVVEDMPGHSATEAPPKTPVVYSHGLYIENDCGLNNLDTCDDTLNPRDLIVSGAWANESLFDVRVCVASAAEDVAASAADNCTTAQVIVVRELPDAPAAASLDFNFSNAQTFGNDWLHLSTDLGTRNSAQATHGAFLAPMTVTSDTWGHIDAGSRVAGVYLRPGSGRMHAYAGTNPAGFNYTATLDSFGYNIFYRSESNPTSITFSNDIAFGRSFGYGFWYWFGPACVNVSFGFGGSIGIQTEVVLSFELNQTGYLQGRTALGGKAYVIPKAVVGASFGAYVNLVAFRAGAVGNVSIVDAKLWLKAGPEVAVDGGNTLSVEFFVDLYFDVRTLSGSFYVYLDYLNFTCSWWSGCWTYWSNWQTWTLGSWQGWYYGYPLYNTWWKRSYNFSTGATTSG